MSENNNVEVENNDATEAEVAPSRTLWSDAWKRLKKNKLATAMAGAVLRPAGSRITRPVGSSPCSCIWAAARKRCSLLQITRGGVRSGRTPIRFSVSPNSV